MSAIPPVSATTPTSAGKTAGGLAATSDTFLKLLVANLQHQDPMQPQDSSAYMQQLSSMSMVEQLTTLSQTQTDAAADQRAATAVALLNKTVTYLDANGVAVTGKVQRVEVAGERPALTVDGIDGIDMMLVTEVAQ